MCVLKNWEELLFLFCWYVKGVGMEFIYLSLEEVFEYVVLEYFFFFWQLGYDCEVILGKLVDLEILLEYFVKVVGLDFYVDVFMFGYVLYYWQVGDEMGYYGF